MNLSEKNVNVEENEKNFGDVSGEGYDSTKDADAHRQVVIKVGYQIVQDLLTRIADHDLSKFQEPEKSCYDKYIPQLREAKYGSKEYYKIREKMKKEGLDHHYQVNRHHPEHFENGIEGMTIVDLVEYFVDTYSASTKSDTPYSEGVKKNASTHKLPKELVQIFINTVDAYF